MPSPLFLVPVPANNVGTVLPLTDIESIVEQDTLGRLQSWEMQVGEIRHFCVAVGNSTCNTNASSTIGFGNYRLLSEAELRKLRVKVSGYGVVVQQRETLSITARATTSTPISVTITQRAGWRVWRVIASMTIDISVQEARGFIALTTESLEDVPSSIWLYNRDHVRSFFYRSRREYQYIIDDCTLGMRAKQELDRVGWARCADLSQGWELIALVAVNSSDEKALVCGSIENGNTFSLKCRRKAGRGLAVNVIDSGGFEHALAVTVLPESSANTWTSVRESPPMRSERSVKWRRIKRLTGAIISATFVVVWVLGCLLSQIQKLGVTAGTAYTLAALGTGLGVVLLVTVVSFIMSAAMHWLSRKF